MQLYIHVQPFIIGRNTLPTQYSPKSDQTVKNQTEQFKRTRNLLKPNGTAPERVKALIETPPQSKSTSEIEPNKLESNMETCGVSTEEKRKKKREKHVIKNVRQNFHQSINLCL